MDASTFKNWLFVGAHTHAEPLSGDWSLLALGDKSYERYPNSPYWCARLRTEALALSSLCSDEEWSEIIAAFTEEFTPLDAFRLFRDMVARRMHARRGRAEALLGRGMQVSA